MVRLNIRSGATVSPRWLQGDEHTTNMHTMGAVPKAFTLCIRRFECGLESLLALEVSTLLLYVYYLSVRNATFEAKVGVLQGVEHEVRLLNLDDHLLDPLQGCNVLLRTSRSEQQSFP